jgi:myo-inositol 2-dehydrogenase / D-chiro-inositol 1-dehydrogenase
VLNNSPTPVSGIDGRVPVVIAKAAGRSIDERRPIRIDEIT